MTISLVLVGLSVIAFVLAFFAVPLPTDRMVAAGLALFAAGHVIYDHYHHHV